MGEAVKVRPVRVTVQVEAVIDDGVSLRPVQSAPLGVAAADWEGFDLGAAVADLQAQVDELNQ